MPTEITAANLEKYREWLLDNGRSEGTARLYVSNLRTCEREGGPVKRLTASELSSNSLHTNKAALASWAEFTEDEVLRLRVKKIKIPPAARTKAKRGLAKDEWRTIVDAIKKSEKTPAPVRACLLVMARRGLRSGDVLRMRKVEIQQALDTGILAHEVKGRRRLEFSAQQIREALEMLAAEKGSWKRVEDLVATSPREGFDRRRSAARVVSLHLRRIATKLGLEGVHPHRLRRTYAIHYLKAMTGDPQALIKLQHHMGWMNMATAAKYVDEVNRVELDQRGVDLMSELDA